MTIINETRRRRPLLALIAFIVAMGLTTSVAAASGPTWEADVEVKDAATGQLCPKLGNNSNLGGCVVSMTNTEPSWVYWIECGTGFTFDLHFGPSNGWVWASNIQGDPFCEELEGLNWSPDRNVWAANTDNWNGKLLPLGDGEYQLVLYATYRSADATSTDGSFHPEIHTFHISHDAALGGLRLENTITDVDETSRWAGFSNYWGSTLPVDGRLVHSGAWESADDVVIEPAQ